jgi:hypothetical protein
VSDEATETETTEDDKVVVIEGRTLSSHGHIHSPDTDQDFLYVLHFTVVEKGEDGSIIEAGEGNPATTMTATDLMVAVVRDWSEDTGHAELVRLHEKNEQMTQALQRLEDLINERRDEMKEDDTPNADQD